MMLLYSFSFHIYIFSFHLTPTEYTLNVYNFLKGLYIKLKCNKSIGGLDQGLILSRVNYLPNCVSVEETDFFCLFVN